MAVAIGGPAFSLLIDTRSADLYAYLLLSLCRACFLANSVSRWVVGESIPAHQLQPELLDATSQKAPPVLT